MCQNGGNRELQQCSAFTKEHAIEQLAPHCPVELDKEGYAKQGNITYVVAEAFDNGTGA